MWFPNAAIMKDEQLLLYGYDHHLSVSDAFGSEFENPPDKFTRMYVLNVNFESEIVHK
jgi:hypothetical protein